MRKKVNDKRSNIGIQAKRIEELEKNYFRLFVEVHDLNSSRAETAKDLRQLEREADWLAAAQNWNVPEDEPTRCPEGKPSPDSCIGINDCTECWREASRKAVGVNNG